MLCFLKNIDNNYIGQRTTGRQRPRKECNIKKKGLNIGVKGVSKITDEEIYLKHQIKINNITQSLETAG